MVTLRDAVPANGSRLRELAEVGTLYAGELPAEDETECGPGWVARDGTRRAEDGVGFVGAYSLLLRRGARGPEAELTIMLVAGRTQHWAVDRMLLVDARRQAGRAGARQLSVLTRPPLHVFFRDQGANVVGVVGPWGDTTSPSLQVELTAHDLPTDR
ncbi:hypothetical protein [uncultured Modestobacter sp.]|uniref:hypothetical protein n=1 Tax=uncultured Modestobacter sp. TaxID=380048 RepID=UPI0026215D73|nr:hypothetical protein [uncultured Modestobacter sp.]